MKKEFTMSKFASKEELYKAKAEYYENEVRCACLIIDDFVKFAAWQIAEGNIDGLTDPDMILDAADVFIKMHRIRH